MIGILLTDEFKLQVQNGNLETGNVDEQICSFVVMAAPGDFKETPTVGCNVRMLLGGPGDIMFKNNLTKQLKLQHLKPKSITMSNTEIAIEL